MLSCFRALPRNFIKNGYSRTDETHVGKSPDQMAPSSGPCASSIPAPAKACDRPKRSCRSGAKQVKAVSVEYDAERATHARADSSIVVCMANLMDFADFPQSFGLLCSIRLMGDLTRGRRWQHRYQGRGAPRLEKLFYQRKSAAVAQYGRVLCSSFPA